MGDKNQSQNLNHTNLNKNKYSKIDSNEDTYLELKEEKQEENENEEDNNNKNNKQEQSNKKTGILNRKLSYYFYMRLGNTFTFFGDKDGSPLIVIGPHWPMYLCLSTFISLIFFYFFYKFWFNINIIFKLSGIIIYLTFFISYTYTFLVNPGIPKYDENALLGIPREKYRFCKPCGIWIKKEGDTSHCFDCNICYEGYDHHCPWTGKCIAKKNANAFYLFLVSIISIICYFLVAFTHAQHNIYLKYKKNKKF